MTQQQTIGNTVYTVGQELKNYTEAGPLLDYMYKNYPDFVFYRAIGWINPVSLQFMGPSFPMLITALPNPDPVAEDWREVHIGDFMQKYLFGPEWPTQPPAFEALQLAMQEVCKAGPYNTRIEYDSLYDEYLGEPTADNWLQRVMTCFLLGGRVFVKGSV